MGVRSGLCSNYRTTECILLVIKAEHKTAHTGAALRGKGAIQNEKNLTQ